MITGTVQQQVDRIWDAFWSGGISNPLEVIEQITYLLFLKRLDDLQTRADNAARHGKRSERDIFPSGKDAEGCPVRGPALVSVQEHGAREDVRGG